MRKLFILVLAAIHSFAFCQTENDKKIFLDSVCKESDETNYSYIRIIKDFQNEKDSYDVLEYYKTGELYRTYPISNKHVPSISNGFLTYYHKNGIKKSIVEYRESKKIGPYTEWNNKGELVLEAEYIEAKKDMDNDLKISNYWNEERVQTVINGNGYLKLSSEQSTESGEVKNYMKNGIWKGYDNTINSNFSEIYNNGVLLHGESIDKDNVKYSYTQKSEYPSPKQGYQHFSEFIAKKLVLPEVTIPKKDKVILGFIVEKNGEISNIEVLKSMNPEIDLAAINVLKKYKKWNPGKVRGKEVRVRHSLPLVIDLKVF